jgi:two-component system sensor histidine kinase AlgZ
MTAMARAPDTGPLVMLPDFRNLGVTIRILLIVNTGLLAAAAIRARTLADLPEHAAEIAAVLEPSLLVSIVILYALARPLLRLPYYLGAACCVAIAMLSTAGVHMAMSNGPIPAGPLGWPLAFAAFTSLLLLAYFRLLLQALSPALSEARLQALQARIRPHFLFNSLNAVLSLVRSDPRRAESALENLAELFRNLMADNRALTSLGEEIALTQSYLELEQLRLGERLHVDWQVQPPVETAAVPPLMLQPLVENAIYHGVEPGMAAGSISISARVAGELLHIVISNPYHPEHQHRQGNRMALANIAERLRLHFDVEAQVQTRIDAGRFEISVSMPFRTLQ